MNIYIVTHCAEFPEDWYVIAVCSNKKAIIKSVEKNHAEIYPNQDDMSLAEYADDWVKIDEYELIE